jgi:hypothetical protein
METEVVHSLIHSGFLQDALSAFWVLPKPFRDQFMIGALASGIATWSGSRKHDDDRNNRHKPEDGPRPPGTK